MTLCSICGSSASCTCTINTITVSTPTPIVVTVTEPTTVPTQNNIVVAPGQGGAVGPKGDKGDKGDQGEPGITQAVAYTHLQGVSNSTWDIQHNLNFYPNVTVVDSAGTIVEGEIDYTDLNNIRLTFSDSFSGKAYLS